MGAPQVLYWTSLHHDSVSARRVTFIPRRANSPFFFLWQKGIDLDLYHTFHVPCTWHFRHRYQVLYLHVHRLQCNSPPKHTHSFIDMVTKTYIILSNISSSYSVPQHTFLSFSLSLSSIITTLPWMSRKSSASIWGPLSLGLPEPLNTLPVM